MPRPDFGMHIEEIESGGRRIAMSCRYVAPGVTFQDLARAFHDAKAKAGPHDHLAGNPALWPDNRGIAAVMDMLLDAVYGSDAPAQPESEGKGPL